MFLLLKIFAGNKFNIENSIPLYIIFAETHMKKGIPKLDPFLEIN